MSQTTHYKPKWGDKHTRIMAEFRKSQEAGEERDFVIIPRDE